MTNDRPTTKMQHLMTAIIHTALAIIVPSVIVIALVGWVLLLQ